MIWDAFAIAVREIARNLIRASLTVLSVFIGVAAIAPMRSAAMSTIHLDTARNTPVIGTTPVYFEIKKWVMAEGRFFTSADLRSGGAVSRPSPVYPSCSGVSAS